MVKNIDIIYIYNDCVVYYKMEKYFEDIEDRFQDFQFSCIESTIYESELKYAFEPAMEADATVASPNSSDTSSTGNSSTDSSSNNPAANTISRMTANSTNNAAKEENRREQQDQQTTNKEGSGINVEKTKQEVMNTVKELSAKLAQFIREHITNLSSTMVQMLKDNDATQREINNLIRTRKLNEDLVFNDYKYNNQFLTDYTNAVTNTISDYNRQYSGINSVMTEIMTLVNDKKYNEAKEKLQSLTNKNASTDNNTTTENNDASVTASISNLTIKSPTEIIIAKLRISSNELGEANITNVKKYAYAKYKGVDDKEKGPQKFLLKTNMNKLEEAIRYVKTEYHDRLKSLNTNRDSIKQSAQSYQNLCNELLKFSGMDDGLKTALNTFLSKLSTHLNEIVALNDFSLTAVKERGVAAVILIKAAYLTPKELVADKSKSNTNTNQQNLFTGKNSTDSIVRNFTFGNNKGG